jgi:hypothetical protein
MKFDVKLCGTLQITFRKLLFHDNDNEFIMALYRNIQFNPVTKSFYIIGTLLLYSIDLIYSKKAML